MRQTLVTLVLFLLPLSSGSAVLNCDMSAYQEQQGLQAKLDNDTLTVHWTGERGSNLRPRLRIDGTHPVIRQMAVRGPDWSWKPVATGLKPDFLVTSGVRRISHQQLNLSGTWGRQSLPL